MGWGLKIGSWLWHFWVTKYFFTFSSIFKYFSSVFILSVCLSFFHTMFSFISIVFKIPLFFSLFCNFLPKKMFFFIRFRTQLMSKNILNEISLKIFKFCYCFLKILFKIYSDINDALKIKKKRKIVFFVIWDNSDWNVQHGSWRPFFEGKLFHLVTIVF